MCYVTGWYRGKKRTMKFAILRIWPQPTDHSSNCYFCMVDPTKRRTGKNVPQIVYPDIPSSFAPVPHCPELPDPTPAKSNLQETAASQIARKILEIPITFSQMRCGDACRMPDFPNQKDVNDLIRDLGLTKSNAEPLISRLKQWNLLNESVQVTDQRKRHETFSNFFSRQDGLCFCNNVAGLDFKI